MARNKIARGDSGYYSDPYIQTIQTGVDINTGMSLLSLQIIGIRKVLSIFYFIHVTVDGINHITLNVTIKMFI